MMSRRFKTRMELDSKPSPSLLPSHVRRSQADCPADPAEKVVQKFCCDEGAALVEGAVSFSIFFLVVFGIIFWSWALYSYVFISNASREATRYAIVRGSACVGFTDCNASNTQIQAYAQSIAFPGITPSSITTSTEWYTVVLGSSPTPTTITDCGSSPTAGTVICNQPGNEVKVTVSYALPLNIPFWKSTTLTLSSSSELVISQ